MKKRTLVLLTALLILVIVAILWIKSSNNFKQDGTFELSTNENPIKIIRDEHGIAYVIANSKADAIRGQAFVTAQDRLFQIEFYRALIKGKAAELVGASMLQSDIKMRVLNLYGNAERSFQYLDETTKQVLHWYCEGFNEYLRVGEDEFPLELGLLGIEPKPLKPIDIVSVTHFIGLFHSQNMDDEILSLNLAAGMENAEELVPLSINLDRKRPLNFKNDSLAIPKIARKKEMVHLDAPEPLLPYPALGSNNWAVSGDRSKSGKPILANDPHVDARVLPGTFYPIGISCPEFKAVGIATPGIPGLLSGRNAFVSFGVTNAYGDSQDLFLEQTDGDFYMQNGIKKPFELRKEVIMVKDSADVELSIRSTERGPIISDFPVFKIRTDDVVSLKWSLAQTKSTTLGFERLLETTDVPSFRKALFGMDNMFFNYVMADTKGNIAHQATGLVPIRKDCDGERPKTGNQSDTWLGFIPKEELPHKINPENGWVGTANHDTRPDDYPYYYSNHFSPFYRYERLKEVFTSSKKFEADDLWELIFDVKNMQAEKLVPIFVSSLEKNTTTMDIALILTEWNKEDEIEEIGASVYNVLYNELLFLLLDDELPNELEGMYWENVYYWNQRLDSLMLSQHRFIDNIETPQQETLSDIVIEAGLRAKEILTKKFGANQEDWKWGKLHTVYFYSPIKKEGFGSKLLGAELLPKQGSNQTLNRGGSLKNKEHNYETSWFSSFRMVADMNDDEKIMGVVSGGSAARIFHPYHKSQLAEWKTGEWIPYWISEEKIMEHAQHELILK
ncbi:MAG: penicillin acylase family protein [Bacteroidota bacterium]